MGTDETCSGAALVVTFEATPASALEFKGIATWALALAGVFSLLAVSLRITLVLILDVVPVLKVVLCKEKVRLLY